jgi:sarcosine oxidase
MSATFDVAVVGLGAMGSAAAYHLARRGRSVLGLDRFAPPHAHGSSHGRTRIIREAYFEHPAYVPLVQRAYELWSELERATGRELLRITGGLMLGRSDGILVAGARRSAEEHRLPHALLTAAEVRSRFPALAPEDDLAAVFEPRAGVLFPERCIEAHLDQARRHGATLRCDEAATAWRCDGGGVRVTTGDGEYHAAQLLLTAGSWMRALAPGLELPLTVERQVLYWFAPAADAPIFAPARCPIHLWEPSPQRFFYGFPDFGDGVKVALHHGGESADPDHVRRAVRGDEVAAMRALVRRFLPAADGALRSSAVCTYTNTPDGHFWIDRHPDHAHVLIASACSGHGFKFSSAIGEALADLLEERRSRFDLRMFGRR